MTDLPLRRLILYKHGVGYFERRGTFEGTTLALPFSREAMDDVLKSLVVPSNVPRRSKYPTPCLYKISRRSGRSVMAAPSRAKIFCRYCSA